MREAPIKVRVHEPHAVRDFGIRTATALAMGAVLIVADLFGGIMGWAVAVSVVAVLCATEYYAFMRTEHRKPNEVFGVIAVAVMPLATAYFAAKPPIGGGVSFGLTLVTGVLIVAALVWNVTFRQVNASDTNTTVFGAVYTGFMLSHLVLIWSLDFGQQYVLVVLFSVWAMDVFAYLVGSAFGTHPLAPRISPKKSWEGFLAGGIGTIAVWLVGWFLIIPRATAGPAIPWWWFGLTGLVVAVAALFGDLTESRLKREVNVKDSGHLLPGHGGFLDRFDSLIMVSIVAYYLLVVGLWLYGGVR